MIEALLAVAYLLGQADGERLPDAFAVHAQQAAGDYQFQISSSTGRVLELRTEPILRWSNPVPEKQMRGEVFVWTNGGRPAAVLNVFQMDEGNGFQEWHEFSSLADVALTATAPKNRHWSPLASQLMMSAVPNASPPAPNPRQRLIQMRNLASSFTCRKINRKDEAYALRLLPQPLLRYESKSHGVSDGGLFTFVEATDPEVFLMLEVREVDNVAQWHFGFVRMASVQLQASWDNKTVWSTETLPYAEYRNRPDLPYALLIAR